MCEEKTFYGDHLKDILSFYDDLLDSQNADGLIIPSGIPKTIFLDDNDYPFKVNVHFKALIPITGAPYCYIVYRPGNKPIFIFYQPEDYWHVVPPDPRGDWVEHFEIHKVVDADEWTTLLPGMVAGFVWLGESQKELDNLGISRINPPEILNPIHFRRACKSTYEINCIKQSNLKAARGHLAAKTAFLCGASEMEIHLAYLRASNQKEEELPYGNIVALNGHSSILHYTDLERQQNAETDMHSFLLDAGAVHHGYCSDITRTWSYREDEFSELIQKFDSLQQEIISELKVGLSYVDMHIETHIKIAEFLKEADFIYCDPQTALETGVSSTFYPHGLGHLLGLQVHDIGGHQISATGKTKQPPEAHPALRLTKTLEPGFCITIEPGIYFIELLLQRLSVTKYASLVNWSKVEAFRHYGGIRIEDDVIINNDGSENLTREAFAEITEND